VAEDILSKQVSPANRSKYIYCLTEKGVDLLPIVIEIMDWGQNTTKIAPEKNWANAFKKKKIRLYGNILEN
jgi:DNA-binding HxlR family transcriptional regulator